MNLDRSFPGKFRLKKSLDFQRTRRTGRKQSTPHFTLYLELRPAGVSRLGITASRKVGNAVERNRIKRLLREFFRANRFLLVRAFDVSIVAKPGAPEMTYRQVVDELSPIFRIAGQEVS